MTLQSIVKNEKATPTAKMAFFVCLQKASSSPYTPWSSCPRVRVLFKTAPVSRNTSAMMKVILQQPSQPQMCDHSQAAENVVT